MGGERADSGRIAGPAVNGRRPKPARILGFLAPREAKGESSGVRLGGGRCLPRTYLCRQSSPKVEIGGIWWDLAGFSGMTNGLHGDLTPSGVHGKGGVDNGGSSARQPPVRGRIASASPEISRKKMSCPIAPSRTRRLRGPHRASRRPERCLLRSPLSHPRWPLGWRPPHRPTVPFGGRHPWRRRPLRPGPCAAHDVLSCPLITEPRNS